VHEPAMILAKVELALNTICRCLIVFITQNTEDDHTKLSSMLLHV